MPDPDLTLLERLAFGNGPYAGMSLSHRPAVLWAAEMAYQTLLFPDDGAAVPVEHRHAIAAFCAHLHLETSVQSHYRGLLRLTLHAHLAQTAIIEAEALHFRDSDPASTSVRQHAQNVLSPDLCAWLAFAGRLTLDPVAVQSAPGSANWAERDVVSRIAALITFQARLVAGLRDLPPLIRNQRGGSGMIPTPSHPTHDGRAALSALENALTMRNGGLSRGERAIVSLAVRLKCGAPSGMARAEAERLTRDVRGITLLIEEGFPSPLTGRAGAIATAAADLSVSVPGLRERTAARLKESALDAGQQLDLVLMTALENMRLRLPPSR